MSSGLSAPGLPMQKGLLPWPRKPCRSLTKARPNHPVVSDLIGQVTSLLNNLSRLDPQQEKLAERAQGALEELTDLAAVLRDYLETVEFNPQRLDQVEERLNLIQTMKRKYGEDIPAVLHFVEQAKQQLDSITHVSERIAELENDEGAAADQTGKNRRIAQLTQAGGSCKIGNRP